MSVRADLAGNRCVILPRFKPNGGRHLVLAKFRGQGKRCAGGDRRVRYQHLLDFTRRHVLARAPDRILHPVDETTVSVRFSEEAVSRVEPKVTPSFDGLVRHTEIAGREGKGCAGSTSAFGAMPATHRVLVTACPNCRAALGTSMISLPRADTGGRSSAAARNAWFPRAPHECRPGEVKPCRVNRLRAVPPA